MHLHTIHNKHKTEAAVHEKSLILDLVQQQVSCCFQFFVTLTERNSKVICLVPSCYALGVLWLWKWCLCCRWEAIPVWVLWATICQQQRQEEAFTGSHGIQTLRLQGNGLYQVLHPPQLAAQAHEGSHQIITYLWAPGSVWHHPTSTSATSSGCHWAPWP